MASPNDPTSSPFPTDGSANHLSGRPQVGWQWAVAVALALLFFLVLHIWRNDNPESAAKNFVEAAAAIEYSKVYELICKTDQAGRSVAMEMYDGYRRRGLMPSVPGLPPSTTERKMWFRVVQLSSQTLRNDGKTAVVQVNGKIEASIGPIFRTEDLTETMRMVKEGDHWKYCGR